MSFAGMTRVTRNGQITLPASARRALRIQEGDYVEVELVADTLVLRPKKLVDKNQAYFWSQKWQAAEREADEDIATGRVYKYEDADAAIAALHEDSLSDD